MCILAETRLEWTLASLGISAAGAVVVPVYPTNSPKECKWVAGNSGARAIFCENEGQRAKIEEVRDELPDLEHVIGIDEGGGELTLDELRARGRERDRGELGARQEQVSPRGPVHDRLHVRHDRRAEGRRADPRATRWRCARWSRSSSSSSPATSATCTCRSPTCSR